MPRDDIRPSEHTRSLRILLVEDDEVCQLATAMALQKWGHAVVVAENGEAALEAFQTGQSPSFDLILMDIVTPRMDGFEATKAIRQREGAQNVRVPIVAMTACTLKIERSLDAGMDDYIAKPIRREALFEVISRVAHRATPTTDAAVKQCATDVVLDARRLLDRLDGDVEFLRRIAELYFNVCSTQLSRIRESVACRDSMALQAAAHKLKGSVSNLNAKATFEAARKLEGIAETGDMAAADDALVTLEKEVSRLNTRLTRLVEKGHTAPPRPAIAKRRKSPLEAYSQ